MSVRSVLAPATPGSLRAAVSTSVAGKTAEVASLAALALLVPRLLGPADYGRVALALTLVTLGTLALTLGGPTVMGRFVPAADASARAALARAITVRYARSRAAALVLVAVAAGGLVAAGAVPALAAACVVGALVASVAATLALQSALGLGRIGPWSVRWAAQNTVTVAAVLGLDAAWGVDGALAGVLVGAVATAAWAWWTCGPALRDAPRGGGVPHEALRFGAWQAVAGTLTQAAQRGGIVAVALAASTTETGYAALAVGLALAGAHVVLQAFTVVLPGLADRARDEDPDAATAALRRLATSALAASAPVALAGAALAPDVVPAVVGEGYRAAARGVGLALALVPLAVVSSFGVQAAALALRPRAAAWAAAAGVAVGAVVAVGAFASSPAPGAEAGIVATVAAAAANAAAWAVLLPRVVAPRLVAGALLASGLVVLLAVGSAS